MLAIGMPSVLEGMAVIQGVRVGETLDGFDILTVLLHKLIDGAITAGVMLSVRYSFRTTGIVLALAACAPGIGLLLARFVALPHSLLALSLAWCSGIFLYLGTLSFLPASRALSPSRWLPFVLMGAACVSGVQWLGA